MQNRRTGELDVLRLLRDALAAAGLSERADALIASAIDREGPTSLPRSAEELWDFVTFRLAPCVEQSAGTTAADRLTAVVSGAILVLVRPQLPNR